MEIYYNTTASEEIEEEDDIFSEFLTNPTAVAAAAAIAGPLALAAVVPPPLPMFPPQGLPQPNAGSVPGSGGGQGPVVPDPGGQVTISPCVSLPCAHGGYVKLNILVSNVSWLLH